jgi:hypothetical protein
MGGRDNSDISGMTSVVPAAHYENIVPDIRGYWLSRVQADPIGTTFLTENGVRLLDGQTMMEVGRAPTSWMHRRQAVSAAR